MISISNKYFLYTFCIVGTTLFGDLSTVNQLIRTIS